MAKHLARAAVRRKEQHRRRAGRLAISTGTAVLAVLAVGLQADSSVSASGQMPGQPADSAATVPAATQPVASYSAAGTAALSASADASLTYSRSMVTTEARKETTELSAASAASRRPAAGTLVAPLAALVPSSPFGPRTSPITGKAGEFHWGLDFSASCGTRVHAADAGVVRAVGWHQWGGGNRVELDHGYGLITTYNHLEGIGVRTGQSVQAGETIATVGTTGASTGCHLHFETILNGSHTDPAIWTLQPLHSPESTADIPVADYRSEGAKAPSPAWTVSIEQSRSQEPSGHSHGLPEEGAAAMASSSPSGASPTTAIPATTTTAAASSPTATAVP